VAVVAPRPATNLTASTTSASSTAPTAPTAPGATTDERPNEKSKELTEFYDKLMKTSSTRTDFRRQSAEDLLARHTSRIGESKQEAGKKILETLKKDTEPIPEEGDDNDKKDANGAVKK
jgi:hypothetical protein